MVWEALRLCDPPASAIVAQAGLPEHLQDKSLRELYEYGIGAMNKGDWKGQGEVFATEVSLILPARDGSGTKNIVGKKTRNEILENMTHKYKGYDSKAGQLYATDLDGKLRMDWEEIITGKLVRCTLVAGSEMIR